MASRTKRETITFRSPFYLTSVGRGLPAGDYELIIDEERIEGLSFASYRRASMSMIVPAPSPPGTTEMVIIDAAELETVRAKDLE